MRILPKATMALLIAAATATPALARKERVPYSAKSCIPLHAIRDETAESDSRLIFHGGGGRAWRSYLPSPCDDIGRINNVNTLKLHSADPDKLCVGDTVQMTDRGGILAFDSDSKREVSCKIGPFESITEMSLTENLRR